MFFSNYAQKISRQNIISNISDFFHFLISSPTSNHYKISQSYVQLTLFKPLLSSKPNTRLTPPNDNSITAHRKPPCPPQLPPPPPETVSQLLRSTPNPQTSFKQSHPTAAMPTSACQHSPPPATSERRRQRERWRGSNSTPVPGTPCFQPGVMPTQWLAYTWQSFIIEMVNSKSRLGFWIWD